MGIGPALSHGEPLFSRVIGLNARLVLALLAGAALLFLDARQGLMAPVRGAVASVTAPVQWLLARPFAGIGEAMVFMTRHHDLLQKQEAMTRQLARLQTDQLTLVSLEAENARLRALAQLPLPAGRSALMAEVIAIPDNAFSRHLTLNIGANAGVPAGAPVIDALGLVGQVTRVDARSSEVTTILARRMYIPLQSERSGLRLLGRGAGSDAAVEIPQMDARAGLEVGDLLVTSGLDGVYPPGLPVARVRAILPPRGSSPFASATAQPVAGATHAGPLLVLLYAQPPAAVRSPVPVRSPAPTQPKRGMQ